MNDYSSSSSIAFFLACSAILRIHAQFIIVDSLKEHFVLFYDDRCLHAYVAKTAANGRKSAVRAFLAERGL